MKTCFFISPIGAPDSLERAASNKLLKFIIEPVLQKCGYEKPVRADQMTQPGVVTSQVFTKLWNDDLVIADLTGSNPNVYYELAVRHIRRRPCVHLIQKGANLPFDVAPNRTIFFDFDVEEANRAQTELESMILSAEIDLESVMTPLSLAIDLAPLDRSENPVEVGVAEIVSLTQDIRTIVGHLDQQLRSRALENNNIESLAPIETVPVKRVRPSPREKNLPFTRKREKRDSAKSKQRNL